MFFEMWALLELESESLKEKQDEPENPEAATGSIRGRNLYIDEFFEKNAGPETLQRGTAP